jgi:molecular chaperone GrpE
LHLDGSSAKEESTENGQERQTPSKGPGEVVTAERAMVEELDELRRALADEHERAVDYLNKMRYLQADFENYRRRAQKEIEETALTSKEEVILSLLSISDELELAVRAGERTDDKKALMDGVKITLKKLYDLLRSQGVAVIETAGKPFDPKLHEAVSTVPRAGCRAPSIAEEIRKGFTMKGKVIRPSVVTVATPASPLQVREDKATPLVVAEGRKPLTIKGKEEPVVKEKKGEGR